MAADPAAVWTALEDLDRFAPRSRWVERIVADPGGFHPGSVVEVVIATPLPFTLRVSIHLDVCRPTETICARVRGDLEGAATLRLRAVASGCLVELSWALEIRQPAMRAMARISGPLLRWGHDVVAGSTTDIFQAVVRTASGAAASGGIDSVSAELPPAPTGGPQTSPA